MPPSCIEGNNVTFRNESGVVYINATQMAEPFDKKPHEYLRLPTTKSLVHELNILKAEAGKSLIGDNQTDMLVITEKGGSDGGGNT